MFEATLSYLRDRGVEAPEVGLILGSGLGDLADELTQAIRIPFEDIPGFPQSTVEGHAGQVVYGQLGGRQVIVLQGRFHFYEGYDVQTVTYPVRIFHELGVKQLIVTNAAGGVNQAFKPGDLMLITDHINLTGENPLIGSNIEAHGLRFVDMTHAYDPQAGDLARAIAREQDLVLQEGVYTWFTGPTYETPAEIRMTRTLGGDAVGMSTVPEVIVANHCGMAVLGISCITNYAAGMQSSLDHEEVVKISQEVKPKFQELIRALVSRW